MTPKIIHQVWVGDKPAPTKWMNTWKEKHPGWKYILWNNEKIGQFNFKNKKHIDYFWKKRVWHGVADVARYEILYAFGGIMPGADSECLNPVDELFKEEDHDAYAIYSNEKLRPGFISPLYGCSKENQFAKILIEELYNKKEMRFVPWIETGNMFMKHTLEKTGYKRIKIFPSHYFIPEHFWGYKYKGKGKIYARHHWGTTLKNYDKGILAEEIE